MSTLAAEGALPRPCPSHPASTTTPETSPTSSVRQDLTRIVLAVISVLLLIGTTLWVLRPFLAAGVWATMLVVSTWPLLTSLQARLGNRRAPAVALMTAGLLLLLILPLWAAIDTIARHADDVTALAKTVAESGLPQPPEWVRGVPVVGAKVAAAWADTAQAGPDGLVARLAPYASDAVAWVLGHVGSVGGMLVHFLLVVILSAILYADGETAARATRRFGRRLAAERGENSVVLAGQAIRAVALGVGVTAVVQTVLGGLGLAVAGVPFAGFLSAVMLMLCIAQLGPALVLFPAVAWMYSSGQSAWGTVLLVWSVAVSALDNVLRPVLIKQGGGPAAAADLRRRHRGHDRLRPDRDLPRAGRPGGHLHPAPGLDRGRAGSGGLTPRGLAGPEFTAFASWYPVASGDRC